MKILIIDDDTDLLEMIARRLTKKGMEVLCASDLTQAVKLFEEDKNIKGIICDYFLKNGETGIQFYEQYIINKFQGEFLLATGDNSANSLIQKYELENKNFHVIEKPYTIENALILLNTM